MPKQALFLQSGCDDCCAKHTMTECPNCNGGGCESDSTCIDGIYYPDEREPCDCDCGCPHGVVGVELNGQMLWGHETDESLRGDGEFDEQYRQPKRIIPLAG